MTYLRTSIPKLSASPEVKRVILAADRTYKKHTASFVQCEKVELHGTYWDGGSRNTYTAVNLETMQVVACPRYAPPQFGGPQVAPTVSIPENIAIVRTGVFCGKTSIAIVYINPVNASKLLPNGVP